MAPHRSNRKGDLGNYRPVSSAADIDNIFLTEEGWVYRHFKGNPSDPKTRYWDEIIVAGQVDRDEERPSRNPIDYGTVIDNEPMVDTLNATPRKYLGLGDTSDANSVDGYESDGLGYGTDEIEFETVIDGVNRVIGATDGCFDYDYKHGTCSDNGGGNPGQPGATGRVSINLIQVTTGDIRVGDDVTFEVQVILEDGATNCDWKVEEATNTGFSGTLATGSTNVSTIERFTAPALASGIFTIEATAIAEDTAGGELLDTDLVNNVEVKDLPTGTCVVQIQNGPFEVDFGVTVVVNVHHEMLDGATFDSITIDGDHPYAIANLVTTTTGDDTVFEFTAGTGNYNGTRDLTVTVSGFDSEGNPMTCTDATSMTVHPEPIFRFTHENQWADGYTPSPGDKFDIKVESTFLSHVDRSTTDYYVQDTTGDISVVKKVDTDRSGASDVTIFEATVGASASGECSIHFRGNAKSSPLGSVTRVWNDYDDFTVSGAPDNVKTINANPNNVTESEFCPYNQDIPFSYNEWVGNCKSIMILSLDGASPDQFTLGSNPKMYFDIEGGDRIGSFTVIDNDVSGSYSYFTLRDPQDIIAGGKWPLSTNIVITYSDMTIGAGDDGGGGDGTAPEVTVTINSTNGTDGYILSGDVTGENATINLSAGNLLSITNNLGAHPLYIKTATSTGTGDQVSEGTVTGQGATNGEVTWDTTGVTPGTYYYQCSAHADMNGEIVVS